jgi:hypothetical protein
MSTNAQSSVNEGLTSRPLSIVCAGYISNVSDVNPSYSCLLSATITNIYAQQPTANQDALDLVKMVDDLLDDISTRFTSTSTELFSKSVFPQTLLLQPPATRAYTDSDPYSG